MKKQLFLATLCATLFSLQEANAIGLSTITTPIKITAKTTASLLLNPGCVAVGLVTMGTGALYVLEDPKIGAILIPLGAAVSFLSTHYGLLLGKSALKDILNYNEPKAPKQVPKEVSKKEVA